MIMEQEQHLLWNGSAGRAWVEAQNLLERMFAPFEPILVQAAGSARHVLDVGCGTGATTLALARLPGVERAIGVDISAPMIAVASERTGGAQFVCADAQRHAFAPGVFDLIVSRFGIMFFDDPVAAFSNLRRAARDDAALCCIAWRAALENPFMTTAERAAAALLPGLPPRLPNSPGQFAFADARHAGSILGACGWRQVQFTPQDVACSFPEAELVRYLTLLGPVGLALQHVDAAVRKEVIATVRAAFAPFVDGDTVRFTAACWRIDAAA